MKKSTHLDHKLYINDGSSHVTRTFSCLSVFKLHVNILAIYVVFMVPAVTWQNIKLLANAS